MRPDPDTAAADVTLTSFRVVSMATAEVVGIEVEVGRCETVTDALLAVAAAVVMETTGENDDNGDDETSVKMSVTGALVVNVALSEVATEDVEDIVVAGDTVVVSALCLVDSVVLWLVDGRLEVLGGSRSRIVLACDVVVGCEVVG